MDILFRLEESSKTCVPWHFQRLIDTVLAERENFLKLDKTVLETFNLENDYILCVLVTVALECGFRLYRSTTANFNIQESREVKYSPKWRDTSRRLYTIDLYLSNLSNDRFILLVVPIMGNAILVNLLTLKRNAVMRSAVEPMLPSQWLSLFSSSIPERFNNLPLLARTVRRFFQREKDFALNLANERNPSLLGIPDELKRNIFRFLSANDFVRLTATCRGFYSYKKDTVVWKHFLKRDYKMESDEPYDFYISKFCSSKNVDLPSYSEFTDHIFPIMLHRTTSSTSLQDYLL